MVRAVGTGIEDLAPSDSVLTDYDRKHFLTYARLIDAANEGVEWKTAAASILQRNVVGDPDAAKLCYDSHLARTRWIASEGLEGILKGKQG